MGNRQFSFDLLALAAFAALSQALADPIETWSSLAKQPGRQGGLFAIWDVDQRQVLAALRSAEHVTRAQVTDERERRVREDPVDPAARDLLGLTYLRYGRLSEAASQFRIAVEADPGHLSARLHLADLFRSVGRIDLEAAEVAEVVRQDPQAVRLRWRLADLYKRLGRPREAADILREVVRLAPDDTEARLELARTLLAGQQPDAASAVVGDVLRQEPARFATLLLRARGQRAKGDWEGAQRDLEAFCKAHPTGDAGACLGLVLLNVGILRTLSQWDRPDPVSAVPVELLRREPDRLPALLLRAACRRAKGDWEGAREELAAIRKSHPSLEAAVQLGLISLHEGKFDTARVAFRDALAARPAEPLLLLGAIAAAQGAGRSDDAVRACQELRRAGRTELAAYLLANLWLSQGDAAALRAAAAGLPKGGVDLARGYDQLLAALPQPEDRRRLALQLNLAPLYAGCGWAAEALDAALAAERVAPKSVVVGQVVAERYAAAGKPADELRVRERLATEFAQEPALGIALARAYLDRHQVARARTAAEEVLRRFPADPDALRLAAEAALRGDDAAAAARAREAIGGHPRESRALYLLLDALVAKGQFRDAGQALGAWTRENPTFVVGPFEGAILAAAEGQMDRAIEHCTIGLSRTPQDPRLRFLAGLLFEQRGDLVEAARQFETAHWVAPESLAATRHLARGALRLGHTAAALAAYRAAAASALDVLPVQIELADALSGLGRSAEAEALLRSLTPPDAATRRTVQGRLALEILNRGDTDRALALADPILGEDPADILARQVAVRAYQRRDDLGAAIAVLQRARAKRPGPDLDAQLGMLLLSNRQPSEAAERLGQAADRLVGEMRSRVLLWRAAALLAAGENAAEPARAAVQEAVASRPADSLAQGLLAMVMALCGLDAPAQHELDRVAKSDPDAPQRVRGELAKLRADPELRILVFGAHAASAGGWNARAAALLDAARARAPEDPGLLYDLARARANAGETAKAIEAAQELVRRQAESASVHFLLGRLLLDARQSTGGEDRHEEAGHFPPPPWLRPPWIAPYSRIGRGGWRAAGLDALRRSASLLGKQSPGPWLALADRFTAAGSVEDAIAAYQTVLAIDPKHAAAANNLAWLLATERPDRLEEAERLALAAVQLNPKVASYRDTLGWVYLLRKKPDEARREILAALEKTPSQALFLYHLGMVHLTQGRSDRARQALTLALAMDPSFQDAPTARATLETLNPRTSAPK